MWLQILIGDEAVSLFTLRLDALFESARERDESICGEQKAKRTTSAGRAYRANWHCAAQTVCERRGTYRARERCAGTESAAPQWTEVWRWTRHARKWTLDRTRRAYALGVDIWRSLAQEVQGRRSLCRRERAQRKRTGQTALCVRVARKCLNAARGVSRVRSVEIDWWSRVDSRQLSPLRFAK